MTLKEILHVLEKANGKSENSTKLSRSLLGLGLSDFVEEFFVGITHDKNMARMAAFFEQNQYFKQGLKENDFFAKFGGQNGEGFRETFKQRI